MEDVTITRRVDLDVSLDELWRLVSEPGELAGWFADSVELDLRPGGAGRIIDGGVHRDVRVDRVDPGHRIEFMWHDLDEPATASRVVIEIGPAADGRSRLDITET